MDHLQQRVSAWQCSCDEQLLSDFAFNICNKGGLSAGSSMIGSHGHAQCQWLVQHFNVDWVGGASCASGLHGSDITQRLSSSV